LVGEADKVGEDDDAEGDDDIFDEMLLGLLLRGTHEFKKIYILGLLINLQFVPR
jgi:hypothetical protein